MTKIDKTRAERTIGGVTFSNNIIQMIDNTKIISLLSTISSQNKFI